VVCLCGEESLIVELKRHHSGMSFACADVLTYRTRRVDFKAINVFGSMSKSMANFA
jgi:hypothetical protein